MNETIDLRGSIARAALAGECAPSIALSGKWDRQAIPGRYAPIAQLSGAGLRQELRATCGALELAGVVDREDVGGDVTTIEV